MFLFQSRFVSVCFDFIKIRVQTTGQTSAAGPALRGGARPGGLYSNFYEIKTYRNKTTLKQKYMLRYAIIYIIAAKKKCLCALVDFK